MRRSGHKVPGPEGWADSYSECAGNNQSPIDIVTASDATLAAGSNLAEYLSHKGKCTRCVAASRCACPSSVYDAWTDDSGRHDPQL